jgi:hypothetical protein
VIQLSLEFWGIPRHAVEAFHDLCSFCVVRQRRKTYKEELRPIISRRPMERIQVDLIDMQNMPDADHNWVMVAIDHFSR